MLIYVSLKPCVLTYTIWHQLVVETHWQMASENSSSHSRDTPDVGGSASLFSAQQKGSRQHPSLVLLPSSSELQQ